MTNDSGETGSGEDGPARRRRGPYAKSAITRERILTTAREVFSSVGYNATSLRTIADRVGMTVPGLLHHFGGKEQMLTAVLLDRDRADMEFISTVVKRRDITPADGFRELARMNAARPGMIRLFTMLAAEALDDDHPAHDYFDQRQALMRSIGEATIANAIQLGLVDPDVDRPLAILAMLAVFDGLQSYWLRDPSIDMEAVIGFLADSLTFFDPKRRWAAPAEADREADADPGALARSEPDQVD